MARQSLQVMVPLLIAFSAASCFVGIHTPSVVDTDGDLAQLSNGTTVDRQRGLMWATADNKKDITFAEAGDYVEDFTLAGYADWRFPTLQELETLYVETSENQTPPGPGCYGGYDIHRFFELTCCCPWALQEDGNRAASFPYIPGMGTMWHHNSGRSGNRVLPVRDLEEDWTMPAR